MAKLSLPLFFPLVNVGKTVSALPLVKPQPRSWTPKFRLNCLSAAMQAWQWNFCPCKRVRMCFHTRDHRSSSSRTQVQAQPPPWLESHTRTFPETYHRLRPSSQRSFPKQRFLVQTPRTTCMIHSKHLVYRGHFRGYNQPTTCYLSSRADMFANKNLVRMLYIRSADTVFPRTSGHPLRRRGQTRTVRGHSLRSVRAGCACCLEPLNCFHGRVNPIALRKQRHHCETFHVS